MMIVKDYQAKCQKGEINQDAEQLWVLEHLEEISLRLKREHKKRSRILSSFRKRQSITGLYLWGGVGIGKTFLMDCFFQHLPFKQKLRMHFHAFMQMVHHELKSLQGREDPLRILAEKIARANIVLCFDELAVSDITDAMILGRLFKILFANGVTLITTSNIKPDDLYKNGLQRQHFLSVIKMLKEHMRVMHLATKMDYRKRHLKQAGVFHTPNNEISLQKMEKTFEILAKEEIVSSGFIDICHRKIAFEKQAGEIIWFDFNAICSVPRSQHDYLEIVKQYKTVFISNIPIIKPQARDKISLFIKLVDVFYDAQIRLVISAAAPIEQLYTQGQLVFEYTRTCSRLHEMQSEHYFL